MLGSLRGDRRRAGWRRGSAKVRVRRTDIQRMQRGENRKAVVQLRDLALAKRFGRAVEEDAEAPVAAVLQQDADLVADFGLRQELGDVLAPLRPRRRRGVFSGTMPSRRSRRQRSVERIEDVVALEIALAPSRRKSAGA